MTTEATRAEVCVVACADTYRGVGEILGHAVGIIPTLGARLAKLTFAPNLVMSDGEAFFMHTPPPLGKTASSGGVLESWLPFGKVFDVLATGRRQSIMGASQIDQYGNQNISLIGDRSHPKRQLIGVRGAPGNTANHRVDYWVPQHSTRIFVEEVDMVSGVGNNHLEGFGTGLKYHQLGQIVTNLCVFGYGPEGRLEVVSVHPGVSLNEIEENTGFSLATSEVPTTRIPDDEELRLIREVLDPKGIRSREVPE
jgi:acyl CoA:acetate/3-ketoacid CoA transferase beta subunit